MQARLLLVLGLAACALAGCQSYFPYGYGGTGPYPALPPGTYAPPGGIVAPSTSQLPPARVPQTYAPVSPRVVVPGGSVPNGLPGGVAAPARTDPSASTANTSPVPNYPEPKKLPEGLGAGVRDDDADAIKGTRPGASTNPSGVQLDRVAPDGDDPLSQLGPEEFEEPEAVIRPASGATTTAKKSKRSPYSHKAGTYEWVRGIVSRDPKTDAWRITYSTDPTERYGGSFTLVEDEKLENLVEGDTVYIQGRIDASAADRRGKPSYRVKEIYLLTDPDLE